MKWLIGSFVVFLIIVAVALFYFFTGTKDAVKQTSSPEHPIVIGLLMGTFKEERWVTDRDLFIQKAQELGAKVVVMDANDDANTQIKQAENLILQGGDVLVIVPQDAQKSAVIIDDAHKAGIKVIAYDRLINNPALDYYVSFDSVKVGKYEAQGIVDVAPKGNFAYVGGSDVDANASLVKEGAFSVLQPRIDSGDIKLVFNESTPGWSQEIAYKNIKNFLAQGGSLDAVVAANDSTAAGVIQALEEAGLAGKVPVSGQDAALSALQNIVTGTQTVTVYKPLKDLAFKAAEMAVGIASGKQIETTGTTANGTVRTPSYLLDVVAVTKNNIEQTVIKDGFHTAAEIYPNH